MEKKRLAYLDMVKGIGICGIIVMHSTLISSEMAAKVSLAATPLFFLASGMLISCTKEAERNRKDVLKRKWRSLMLPFLSFSLLYILRDFISAIAIQEHSDMSAVQTDVLESATFWGISVLWFLTTLFFSEIMFIFLRRKYSAVQTYLICAILTGMSFFANGILVKQESIAASSLPLYALIHFMRAFLRAAYALPFLCIGYALFEHFRGFWEEERKYSPVQIAGGVFLLGVGIYLTNFLLIFDFRMLYFGERPFLVYVAATLFFTGSLLVCKNCRPVRGLVYLGKNSLIVMATHVDFYFVYLGMGLANLAFRSIPGWSRAFSMMVVFGTVAVLEVICITVINRFFPFLAGKRKYSHSRESLL